jgi:hypothetical protein
MSGAGMSTSSGNVYGSIIPHLPHFVRELVSEVIMGGGNDQNSYTSFLSPENLFG